MENRHQQRPSRCLVAPLRRRAPSSSGSASRRRRLNACSRADAAAPLALNLLAAIASPHDPTFAPPPAFAAAPADPSAELADTDDFILLSPTPSQQIIPDPSIPLANQRLALRARTPYGSAGVISPFHRRQTSATPPPTKPLWWSPPPAHTNEAVSNPGHSAVARIDVKIDPPDREAPSAATTKTAASTY